MYNTKKLKGKRYTETLDKMNKLLSEKLNLKLKHINTDNGFNNKSKFRSKKELNELWLQMRQSMQREFNKKIPFKQYKLL